MFTVALIGPDGAGKTTVARRLERSLPFEVKYLYMGVSPESSNVLLPTSRMRRALRRAGAETGRREAGDSGRQERCDSASKSGHRAAPGLGRRGFLAIRSAARLANRLGEEWFRQGLAWYHVRRGRVVVFDRHFYPDYYMHDVAPIGRMRSLERRVHGFVLVHLYPKPDLFILLDAPAGLLLARRPEETLIALEQRRQEYYAFKAVVPGLAIVDASRPADQVAEEVSQIILDFKQSRRAHGVGRE